MDQLDIVGLRAFVAVAEFGSFQKAAMLLNLSSTSIGRRVKKLEVSLGAPLFHRTTREVRLTSIGSNFLPTAQRVLNELKEASLGVRNELRYGSKAIAIGCLPTIAMTLAPEILSLFHKKYDLGVRILDVSASEMLKLVRNGSVEFGVSFVGAQYDDLSIEHTFSEPIVAFVSMKNELASRERIDWKELENEKLISIAPASGTRNLIDVSMNKHGTNLNWFYEVQHLATAVTLADAGFGIAIAPILAIEPFAANVAVVRLDQPKIERKIGILRRLGVPMNPATKHLYDLFATVLREHDLAVR